MHCKVLIAGAGHGGLATAYHLAKNGVQVTVLESSSLYAMGLDQPDSVNLDCFEKADIPVPEEYVKLRTPITLCCNDDTTPDITQVVPPDGYTVFIERKILCQYLIGLAMEVGVNIVFNTKITGPIIFGSRVCGVHTEKGDYFADIVIDSCGVNSPLKTNLPEKFLINSTINQFDILHTYRAFYNKIPDCPETEPYKVYVFEDGNIGMQWIITNDDDVDVLIGRFNPYQEEDTTHTIESLKRENPQLGNRLIRGGHVTDIPVRQPLSILVADGYAAIGDCAFMTYSIKGSGVGYAMQAGKILADTILADKDELFTAQSLWAYQVNFFKEIGKNAAIIALGKVLLTMLTTEDVAYLLKEGIINQKIIDASATKNGLVNLITDSGVNTIKDKMLRFFDNKELQKKLRSITVWLAKLLPILNSLPEDYVREDVKKWADKYDSFYNSIRFENNNLDDSDNLL